jgi:aspartyl-tRNA(Asn)/glutamyl-tRNA(Gln) amidotransferase subunit C
MTDDDAATVDRETVRHVADLARIDLEDEEVDRFCEQFHDVLAHFQALEDVPEVEPEPDLVNVFRPDDVRPSLSQGEALQNAPETEDGYVKGPDVS